VPKVYEGLGDSPSGAIEFVWGVGVEGQRAAYLSRGAIAWV
jgi:hypothetical protein